MKPHTLSMSKIHLAMVCAHSFRPDVVAAPRPSGKEARIGTAVHQMVEHWFLGTPVPAWKDPLDEDSALEAMRKAEQAIAWLAPKRERIIVIERGVRYDTERDAAEWGPRRGEPGYDDVPPMTLKGTLDILMRGEDGILENLDIKTGKKENMHEEQIRTQGLAVARRLGESRVRVGFLRPLLTRCDAPEWIDMTENDLDALAGELHGLLRRIPTAEPKPGGHCRRCDYWSGCPAWGEELARQKEKELEAAGMFG